MLLLAAGRTEGAQATPAPYVLLKGLGDFCVTYEINVFCKNAQQMDRIYTDLEQNILDAFNEHGVQIMTPAYNFDPPTPKVVPQEQWFAPPNDRLARRDLAKRPPLLSVRQNFTPASLDLYASPSSISHTGT